MDNPKLVAASAIALAVTLFAIFSMRSWARRIGLVDKPDARKHHKGQVPVIGGICFFLGTLVGLSYLGYIDRFVMSLMLGSAVIVAVGVADDLSNLGVRPRLLIESAVVGLVILSTGFYVDQLGELLPGWALRLGPLGVPLTIVAVIGLINAFNMLDGIDGLAASSAMVSIAAILLYDHADWSTLGVMFLLQVLFASLIPYVFVNLGWPDGRKVFMGDAGSTVIGFLIGWSLIFLSHPRVARLAPVDVLWCVALPVIDTLAVMYRRLRQRRSPFSADRRHVHHLLMDAGYSSRSALLAIVTAGAALAALGYVLRDLPDIVSLATFVTVLLVYMFGLPRLLRLLHKPLAAGIHVTGAALTLAPVADALPEIAGAPVREGGIAGKYLRVVAPPRQWVRNTAAAQTPPQPPVKALCVLTSSLDAARIAPIAQQLLGDPRFAATICVAGPPECEAETMLGLFGMFPDIRLHAGATGKPTDVATLTDMQHLLDDLRPDVVLVPGDAATTFAISLATCSHKLPLVCVDADPFHCPDAHWPNEASRKIVQAMATLHLAASESAGQRLVGEGVPAGQVLVSENLGGGTLSATLQQLRRNGALRQMLATRFPFLRAGNPLLLAISSQAEERLGLPEALAMIARRRPDVDIVWVSYARQCGHNAGTALGTFANVHAMQATSYLACLHLLDRAHLVLADRAIRAEIHPLGKPVLLLQEEMQDTRGEASAGGNAASATAIAGRILGLLGETASYQALCREASSDDTHAEAARAALETVLEALANLQAGNRAAEPAAAAGAAARAVPDVREAS